MKFPQIGQEAWLAISEGVERKDPVSNLEQVGVGQRMINLLHDHKIYDMEDLVARRPEELLGMNNFGERQLQSLFSALSKYHLVED